MKMQCQKWKMQELKRYHMECFLFSGEKNTRFWNFIGSVSTSLSFPRVFLLDILVNDALVYSVSAETFFQLSWLSSNSGKFISWIELISNNLHVNFRSDSSISLYLCTSSSEYMLICLMPFGKNLHNSDAHAITVRVKAIAFPISFLIDAPMPPMGLCRVQILWIPIW